MNNTLWLLRGVSGSGKSTVAQNLEQLEDSIAIAADDFWYLIGDGEYKIDVKRLGEAHSWCRNKVRLSMRENYSNVIVHNTNTSESEIQPYIDYAKEFEYQVVSLIVEKRHTNSNVHDVPDNVLERQERKLRGSIKLS